MFIKQSLAGGIGALTISWNVVETNSFKSYNKNQPAAKCFSEISTNCEVPFLKTHQLLSIHTAVGGFLDQALCSW